MCLLTCRKFYRIVSAYVASRPDDNQCYLNVYPAIMDYIWRKQPDMVRHALQLWPLPRFLNAEIKSEISYAAGRFGTEELFRTMSQFPFRAATVFEESIVHGNYDACVYVAERIYFTGLWDVTSVLMCGNTRIVEYLCTHHGMTCLDYAEYDCILDPMYIPMWKAVMTHSKHMVSPSLSQIVQMGDPELLELYLAQHPAEEHIYAEQAIGAVREGNAILLEYLLDTFPMLDMEDRLLSEARDSRIIEILRKHYARHRMVGSTA